MISVYLLLDYLNKKAVKTLVFQNKIVNLHKNYNNEELWKKNYRLYI